MINDMYSFFLAHHPKLRGSPFEGADRLHIFEERVRTIIAHNQDPQQTWKAGINQFSDLTAEEFHRFYLLNDVQNCSATNTTPHAPLRDIPNHWDRRDLNVVTPVKDQLICGSCWTFSTVGTLESRFIMKYGKERLFSEQQLVDCAGAFENYGCLGGMPS
jgi:cathepsin H